MNVEISSLFELYEPSLDLTPRVIFCDLKSKHTLNNTELNKSINCIAETLTSTSILNSVVVCLVKPHVMLPAFILGILKTSSAFAFLDTHAPLSSLKSIQKYSAIGALLVDDMLLEDLKGLCSCWEKKISKSINNFSFTILQSLGCSDKMCPNSKIKLNNEICNISLSQSKLAFIMQTSGSTGEPKIVQVPHQCILPNIIDLKSRFNLTSQDVILLCSPLTFDPSIIDIFLSIASGCTLVIVSNLVKSIPKKFAEVITYNKVTVLQGTPSLISSLGDDFIQNHLLSKESCLKILAFGGEICPSQIKLLKWVSKENKTQLFNLYGLTEVSCWSMCYRINLQEKNAISAIPLGEPLMNTIIDIDKEGELYIGGNDRWCRINEEQCSNNGKQVLRATGDMVYKTSEGNIYFERRKDNVIKYKGKKLCLHNMKNNLDDDTDISNYALFYDHNSLKVFIFIVWKVKMSNTYFNLKRSKILTKLREVVPNLPAIEIITVPLMPLTLHGKVDYRKLLGFVSEKLNFQANSIENCNEIISDLWKEFTYQKNIDKASNFLISGGNSISAVHMAADIEWKLEIAAPDLIETILNNNFNDVIKLVQTYLQNKETTPTSHSKNYDFANQQEKTVEPHLKKRCHEKEITNSLCYKMVFKQGSTLCCTHSDGHSISHELKSNHHESASLALNMKFKCNLKKCIDASPCIVQFLESEQLLGFIGSHAGIFCCINMISGDICWKMFLPDRIESSACLSSCGCYDHHLYCFDVKEGTIVWKFKTEAEIKCSPVVSKQNIIFVGSHDKNLYAIEKSGDMLWKNKISKGSIFSSPILCEELQALCVATLDGIVAFVKMDSGIIIWMYETSKALFSSPRIISKSIYIGSTDCNMLRFDLSGNLLSKFKTNGPVFSSACHSSFGANCITFGCHDCNIYCVNDNAELLWKFCCESPVYATPFTFNFGDNYYIAVASTSGMLYILQQENGKLISSHKCPGEVFSSPVIIDDMLIIGCRDDYIYTWKLAVS